MAESHLESNVLTKLDAMIMGVAGTAPAYTISASTAALVGAVGLLGPGSVLYAAISMFGIGFAFLYLNKWRSDAGASYAWVGRSINPSVGFMSGWALLVSTTLFMIAGSLPVGSATLDLLNPHLANNMVAVTVVGGLWFLAMDILILMGISITAKFQKIMTIVEVGALLVIAVGAFVHFGRHPIHHFSWSWFSPGSFSFKTFMAGSLVAIFYYWGWDVTANLTEETENRNSAPGIGGVLGMVGIFVLFELMQVAFQLGLTNGQINHASSNLLPYLGNLIFPRPWGDLAIIAVMISTVATLETSLLQASRTLYAMGRDGVVGKTFGEIHPKFKTPWLASIVIGGIAIVIFVLTSFSSGINNVMTDAISAIGIQIAFYYGLSGFACAWYYRKTYRGNIKSFIMRGLWPGLSGAFLWFATIYDIPALGLTVNLIGLGTLLLGVIPLIVYRVKYKSSFYSGGLEVREPTASISQPAPEAMGTDA